jgi:O-antigen ligase
MVSAHPIRGIGTGQFAISSVHYLLQPGALQRGDLILSTPKVAHNTYLNIVAEVGLVGGLLFASILVVCLACMIKAVKCLRDEGDERLEILARGLIVGLGGYLVTIVFISENYAKLFWILLALGPALLAVARSPDEQAQELGIIAARRRPVYEIAGAGPLGASP